MKIVKIEKYREETHHSFIVGWYIGVISSDSEGCSNSILEYIASRIPVIATAVGGDKGIIENGLNGFFPSRFS